MTTTFSTSRRNALKLGLAATLAAPAAARAQQGWPNGPITWVNPFPAGGGTDVFARPLAAQVGEQLGVQILIDNKGGAGGTVGASQAAKMKPDGQTFFVGAIHHTIAPSVYKNLDYDLEKNFEPITMIALVPQVISINPNKVPVKTAAEFIAYLKANPNKVNYASPGAGTAHHLAGELFKLETKTEIVHVPYRGAGPAMQDLLAGNTDMMFDGMGTSAQQIKAGKLLGLAVATDKRSPEFPNIPTAAEIGVPSWLVSTWYGVWAIKGTPEPIVKRMYDEIVKALAVPKLQTIWKEQLAQVGGEAPADFAKRIRAEIEKWQKVVAAAGVKLD
ncbi:tripartite tricarboxylate transporter substrate binding protein [Reyranella sp. MMS21-HV4-11]|uniref:Tripartite tricarboxylate transporter substrate binding protein n=1 Tax=Reyranella humidisoli TaxID=2849149 RepID=A0ABS6IQT3_9HYPH|nr:tripartite tricarboxylate transporter substrate binding protein [Reyranella sp. MMS21-HV4-11]MBU8876380.1 tripartite tricarboxylate transporter substrate binding protein [Reyranella sp. MMS21-HV4-11]